MRTDEPSKRGLVIGPDIAALTSFFPLYREAHPIHGERTRLTLVGWPLGRARRAGQRLAVFGVNFAVVYAVLRFVFDVRVLLAFLATFPLALAVIHLARAVKGTTPDRLLGLVLTTDRLLVAEDRRHGPRLRSELPAGVVTWGKVEIIEIHGMRRASIPVVTIGGPDGDVWALELDRVDIRALRLVLDEAGLDLPPA